jgi:sulfur carrier protein
MTIGVTVNGQLRDVPPGTTLSQLVPAVTELPSGVAAAVNGKIVPRRAWDTRPVQDGDWVEVVTAVPGG